MMINLTQVMFSKIKQNKKASIMKENIVMKSENAMLFFNQIVTKVPQE
jgi:hypothetical protein